MEPADYRRFTEDLVASLRNREEVIGLIAVGSMAERGTCPDAWSDHDFFVITRPGSEEAFRRHLHWLPRSDEITLSFRETEHGLKVLYQNGHLLEFAVFTPEQLRLASVNSYRILFSHLPFEDLLAEQAARSTERARARASDPAAMVGQFLCNLQVGFGRFQRGEHLSGHLFVKCHAFSLALQLFQALGQATPRSRQDTLDPARRFGEAFPDRAAELGSAMLLPVPQAARELLRIVVEGLLPHCPALPRAGFQVLEGYLAERNR